MVNNPPLDQNGRPGRAPTSSKPSPGYRLASYIPAISGLALGGYWAGCIGFGTFHRADPVLDYWWFPGVWWKHLILLAAALGLGSSWTFFRIRFTRSAARPKEITTDTAGTEDQRIIKALIMQAISRSQEHGTATLALLADMLAEPKTYRHRRAESVDLDRRSIKRTVQTEIFLHPDQLPRMDDASIEGAIDSRQHGHGFAFNGAIRTSDRYILIPLAQQEKGVLYDGFTLESSSDESAASLSYGGDSMATYVAVLMHLYALTFGLGHYQDWGDPWREKFLYMINVATWSVHGLASSSDTLSTTAAARAFATVFENELSKLARKDGLEVDQSQKDKLLRIATIGIDRYVIVVRCRAAEYLNITYSYTQPTAALWQKAQKGDVGLLSRLPYWFIFDVLRLPSGYMELSMIGARYARSYHLKISAPERGSYIETANTLIAMVDGRILPENEKEIVQVNAKRAKRSIEHPYLRGVTISGSDAHAYGRHLGKLFLGSDNKAGVSIDDDAVVLGTGQTTTESHRQVIRSQEKEGAQPIVFNLRLRVRELPTGTELFAMIASWSLLLVTAILARVLGEGGDTDVVLAALALPATIGALAIFFVDAFERGMIVSIAGFSLTILTVFELISNGVVFATEKTSEQAELPWSWYWVCALGVAAVLTVTATGTFLIRLYRYRNSQTKRTIEVTSY
ncbi:hypothetical protein IRT45_05790 [Nocardia sp. BSTN01]|uniref:hypothetical protein n=1 Tax=Nocardia sp. BSTN01 TaxID=2783665 RepID=UPI00188DF45F|nr:hypothetical protein [Nocardia sp. BSTN01]MBF4996666.1 hypothetical protein [Nocardia sp. BSTN01]